MDISETLCKIGYEPNFRERRGERPEARAAWRASSGSVDVCGCCGGGGEVRGETLSRKRRREARNGETARGESGVDSEFRQRRGVRLLRWWWWLLLGHWGLNQ